MLLEFYVQEKYPQTCKEKSRYKKKNRERKVNQKEQLMEHLSMFRLEIK